MLFLLFCLFAESGAQGLGQGQPQKLDVKHWGGGGRGGFGGTFNFVYSLRFKILGTIGLGI